MSTAWYADISPTPLGKIWSAVSRSGLVAVEISETPETLIEQLERMGFDPIIADSTKTRPALEQIQQYLAGDRQVFTIAIDWNVLSPFQREVLGATFAIPYGETTTYGALAQRVRRPQSARAVGRAQATNPMPLVIPCHRVVGADGGLHGYGAGEGLVTKAWLLDLEKKNLGTTPEI